MASRDVTVNLKRIDEYLPPKARAEVLQQVTVLGVGRIKRRTKSGVDVNGQPFAPYSARYASQRRRAGWQTTPDLWLRGGMLNGLAVIEVTPDRALIGFQGSSARTVFRRMTRSTTKRFLYGTTQTVITKTSRKHRKTGERIDLVVVEGRGRIANAEKAYFNQNGKKPRKHFGLSKQDRVELTKQALRLILRIVGQQSLTRAARR